MSAEVTRKIHIVEIEVGGTEKHKDVEHNSLMATDVNEAIELAKKYYTGRVITAFPIIEKKSDDPQGAGE